MPMLTEQLIAELEEIFQERGYIMSLSSGRPTKVTYKKGPTSDILSKLDKVQKDYAMANIKSIEKKKENIFSKQKKSAVSPHEKTALTKALKRVTPASEPERRGDVLPIRARKAA